MRDLELRPLNDGMPTEAWRERQHGREVIPKWE